jgi:hypothetical protein
MSSPSWSVKRHTISGLWMTRLQINVIAGYVFSGSSTDQDSGECPMMVGGKARSASFIFSGVTYIFIFFLKVTEAVFCLGRFLNACDLEYFHIRVHNTASFFLQIVQKYLKIEHKNTKPTCIFPLSTKLRHASQHFSGNY